MAKATKSKQPGVITIPFQELMPADLASRPVLRETAGIKETRRTWSVDIGLIRVREGFNLREKPEGMSEEDWDTQLEIPDLAAGLMAGNDYPEVCKGDFTTEGLFILTDGHRRHRAHLYLINQGITEFPTGRPVNQIEVLPNPKEFTEMDRMRQQATSNNNLKYTPMQMARHFQRMQDWIAKIENRKASSEELATIQGGVSRQYVDNMLILLKLPPDKQRDVELGNLKATLAVSWYREQQRQEKGPKKSAQPKGGLDDEDEIANNSNPADKLLKGGSGLKALLNQDLESPDGDDDDLEDNSGLKGEWDSFINGGDAAQKAVDELTGKKALTHDKDSVKGQEEKANAATSPKARDPRPAGGGKDALGKIDFTKEKTEAELDLNEVNKIFDQITVKMDQLPKNLKQYAEDVQRLCAIAITKVYNVQAIIKKAADER